MRRTVLIVLTIVMSLYLFSFSVWSLPAGAVARLGKGWISRNDRGIAFSPDGGMLAVATSISVYLYNLVTLAEIALFETNAPMTSVAFSPDGALLASGSEDNAVKLWDVQSRQLAATLTGHTSYVSSVAFSPDGALLASGSEDNTVKLWDVQSRQLAATLTGHTWTVFSVAFSPDGALLASGSLDRTVKLWDVQSRKIAATLTGHTWWVYSLAFSPDGALLASGSYDGTILLWDMKPYMRLSGGEAVEPGNKRLGMWGEVKRTALLQNFPNPFNPDTWIPYQLRESSEVTIQIFSASGGLVRELKLGYKPAGVYVSKDRAAYWDGKNRFGESAASGIYFYSIQTQALKKLDQRVLGTSVPRSDFDAVMKMVILK